MSNVAWYLDPARKCANTHPSMWMPNKDSEKYTEERLKELRAICKGCPVFRECEKDAIRYIKIGFQAGRTHTSYSRIRQKIAREATE